MTIFVLLFNSNPLQNLPLRQAYAYIQNVPGGKVNIVGRHKIVCVPFHMIS
jgi:hypothetical protein